MVMHNYKYIAFYLIRITDTAINKQNHYDINTNANKREPDVLPILLISLNSPIMVCVSYIFCVTLMSMMCHI